MILGNFLAESEEIMRMVKNIVVSNVIGAIMVVGACVGIVGGSMVLCGAAMVGLWISGG